jgi:hypothetical protein
MTDACADLAQTASIGAVHTFMSAAIRISAVTSRYARAARFLSKVLKLWNMLLLQVDHRCRYFGNK